MRKKIGKGSAFSLIHDPIMCPNMHNNLLVKNVFIQRYRIDFFINEYQISELA